MVRGISDDCSCSAACEDLNHLFRRCPVAVKVNVDGSRRCDSGAITAGGVARNSEKVWLAGFVVKKGVGSALCAELWAILEGLKLAWSLGCRRVIVETNSMEAVECFNPSVMDNHPLWNIIHTCRRLIKRDWLCHITHVFREGNNVVNGLAQMGQVIEENYGGFSSPPAAVLKNVMSDLCGSVMARMSS
ncbi:hypothetical protein ACOSQ4_012823 [Xanthoceras sorbifolium]